MALRNILLASVGAAAVFAQDEPNGYTPTNGARHRFPYQNNTSIWKPAEGEQLIYPRYVELLDGTILVTVSRRLLDREGGPEDAYFPVYSSTDGGSTWDWISNITDQVNGWGMGAQPALVELTEDIGDYKEGTILASGNSWSENGTRIDVYASMDKAQSWEFVSHVAEGTAPNTTNGAHPIWEPYLMLYDHQVVTFYSDQRDRKHGQKLAHQVSTDLKNWGPVVNDVAYPVYADRPGMTVIAHLPDDTYIFVHEYPGGQSLGLAKYPVYYHIAKSPLDFFKDDPAGRGITADQGFQPSSSPYVVWSPLGGVNGTIVVSDADHTGVFINTMLGDPSAWRYKVTNARAAYSRALAIWNGQPHKLAIISGAGYNDAANNVSYPLTLDVIDLQLLINANPPPNDGEEDITPISIYYPNIDRAQDGQ